MLDLFKEFHSWPINKQNQLWRELIEWMNSELATSERPLTYQLIRKQHECMIRCALQGHAFVEPSSLGPESSYCECCGYSWSHIYC
jgi:hypothetical protein